jgi:hypothetical protein
VITKQQFDFLLGFIERSTSGRKYSQVTIAAAEKYMFDREAWREIKELTCGRACVTRQQGKALAEKIENWHGVLSAWPSDIAGKFNAFKKLGGKPIQESVVNAAVQYVNEDIVMHKAAVDNGCFSHSVKSALGKIEKYDEAAKEYGEL